ncbi:MAG: hypothetical protein Q8S02_08445 [Hydrogenophaga sp.]|nr:hypothetical protein [Hydrogenophaga sp.]
MTDRDPPKTKLEQHPGESVWEAMARELASNPDSPASLNIMSAVGKAARPRTEAVEQVVAALEAQLHEDGEQQRAAVQAAIRHWERECGTQMGDALLQDLQKTARERIERRRRQPPKMESILSARPATTDTGYQLGIHLEGLEGTWHRLWGIICLVFGFGDQVESDEGVLTVRAQFEALLGRTMTPAEWSALMAHAKNHHETVVKPTMVHRDKP